MDSERLPLKASSGAKVDLLYLCAVEGCAAAIAENRASDGGKRASHLGKRASHLGKRASHEAQNSQMAKRTPSLSCYGLKCNFYLDFFQILMFL